MTAFAPGRYGRPASGTRSMRPQPRAPKSVYGQHFPKHRGVAVQPQRLLHEAENWRQWTELTVRVKGLPPSVKTVEIWGLLHSEGEISRIELHEDSNGQRSGEASVTFMPPPAKAFWQEGSHAIQVAQPDLKPLMYTIDMFLQSPKRSFTHTSPANAKVRYPENMILSAASIQFGFMYSPNELMSMQTVGAWTDQPITFTTNLARREVVIEFPHAVPHAPGSRLQDSRLDRIRFQIPLRDLGTILELAPTEHERFIVIDLSSPTKWFRKLQNVEATHDEGRSWSAFKGWSRQTEIPRLGPIATDQPLTFKNDRALIDIGRWTTYKLTFRKSTFPQVVYDQIHNALLDYNVRIVSHALLTTIPRKEASVWDVIDSAKARSRGPTWLSELSNEVLQLSWPVRYQLESCISLGCINERNITRQFVEKLNEIAQKSEQQALVKLEVAADAQKCFYNPMDIFDLSIPRNTFSNKLPKHCMLQRSATVTPSTIYFSTPTAEMSNRILREHQAHTDRFLRVRFTDEKNEGRIHSTTDNSSMPIYNRVHQCLKYGIKIGDRTFEFLAAGNSQFREHGAYFFCPTPFLTTDMIRTKMGSFGHIKTVSKYASRLGQCFSTTRSIRHSTTKIKEIDDVTRNGYNFTDGVGKISQYLGSMIATELRLPTASTSTPSLFQFRMGGSKGVLTVWPDVKDLCEIQIRESQYKFPAPYQGIEIIRWSSYSTPRLNRQLITVLNSMNVPDHVYIKKLDTELARISRAMHDEATAIAMLQQQVDFNQMTLELAGIIHNGFIANKDPFAISMLRLWGSWSLKLLKAKAAIPIKDGAFLFGCTDETALLKGYFKGALAGAGTASADRINALPEIFVQVPDFEQEGKHKVIEEVCIVARNPSLHPGDIRVVRAVDKPELRHLKDVVVFPQTGDHDIPNMCSGGDLDGDDFVVIWDKDLIPPSTEWDYPAMDFTGPKGNEVDNVTIDKIASFFVQYMQKDTLRQIATWHIANADGLIGGVRHPRCIELAKQHSIAVDYPKSGVAPNPGPNLKPDSYPHFMPSEFRAKSQIYHSKTVLGALYDQVPVYDFKPLFDLPFDQRVLTAFGHDDERLAIASELKFEYDSALRRIMAQHAIATEFEVWSAFVMNHAKVVNEYKIAEEIGRLSSTLKDQFVDLVHERAGGTGFDIVAPWVAAMYVITEKETRKALELLKDQKEMIINHGHERICEAKEMPLISFPWIFHRELGRIARGSRAAPLPSIEAKQAAPRPKRNPMTLIDFDDPNDVLETSTDTVHGGQLLKFFDDNTHISEGTLEDRAASGQSTKVQRNTQGTDSTTLEDGANDHSELATIQAQWAKQVDANITERASEVKGRSCSPKKARPTITAYQQKSRLAEATPSERSITSVGTGVATPSSCSDISTDKVRFTGGTGRGDGSLRSWQSDTDSTDTQARSPSPLSKSSYHDELASIFGALELRGSDSATLANGEVAFKPRADIEVIQSRSAKDPPFSRVNGSASDLHVPHSSIVDGGEEEWLDEEESGRVEITIDKDGAPSALGLLATVLRKRGADDH